MILYRNVFYIIGVLFFVFSGLMLFPAFVDFCMAENTAWGFLIAGAFSMFLGGLLFFSCRGTGNHVVMGSREKLLTVFIFWLTIPLLSALPYYISPFNISFIDSLFEATAALTTSGADSIQNLKSFSYGFVIWHAFMQLSGGICFIISCIYVFYELKTINIFSVKKVVGVESRYVFKQIQTLLIVFLILIVVSMALMAHAGVAAIDALHYSVAALTCSGITFDISTEIIQKIRWILIILMFVGGCSVGFINRFVSNGISVVKNTQFIVYSAIIFVLTLAFLPYFLKIAHEGEGIFQIFGKTLMTVVSSVTATGIYESSEVFGGFSDIILYITNFIGGCSGSCTGGIKIFRLITLFLILKSYFMKLSNSRTVYVPTYRGRQLDEIDTASLLGYFICYIGLAVVLSLLLSATNIELGKSFSAILTTLNNNGPFFELHKAAPMEIAVLSPFAKVILIFSMIAGRTEYVLFFMMLLKTFWRK